MKKLHEMHSGLPLYGYADSWLWSDLFQRVARAKYHRSQYSKPEGYDRREINRVPKGSSLGMLEPNSIARHNRRHPTMSESDGDWQA